VRKECDCNTKKIDFSKVSSDSFLIQTMSHVVRSSCCHETALSHSATSWREASGAGKELRAPSTQTTCTRRILVPVIYIRERGAATRAGSRVHSSYASGVTIENYVTSLSWRLRVHRVSGTSVEVFGTTEQRCETCSLSFRPLELATCTSS